MRRRALGAHRTSKHNPLQPPSATHFGMEYLKLTDPDGFNLCFQRPIS
jgi:hypothetical protein